MPPRHFWWLLETIEADGAKQGNGLSQDEKAQLLRLMNDASKDAG